MIKYTCERCGKKFNQKYNLERHANRKFVCGEKQNSNPNTTKYHTNTAQITQNTTIVNEEDIENKLKHMCKYCLKRFSRKDVLNRFQIWLIILD
jgi:uncharacterized Zn-finger protein